MGSQAKADEVRKPKASGPKPPESIEINRGRGELCFPVIPEYYLLATEPILKVVKE